MDFQYQTPQGDLISRMLEHLDKGFGSQSPDVRDAVKNGSLFIFGDGTLGDNIPSFKEVFKYFIENYKRAVIEHGEKVSWIHLPCETSRNDPLGQVGYVGFMVKA